MENGKPPNGIVKEKQFVAHTDRVNCLVQGYKSKQLFATGGDDGNVNLWRVDRANCLSSLNVSKTCIDSVSFDNSERIVASGTRGGSIVLFSLNSGKKIQNSFTGHRSACTALAFHPLGNYIGSGSTDTNVKLWDIRRRNCVHTFKGHEGSINCLKYSPDGHWITSASVDGTVRIWDLNTGKLFKEIKAHDAEITSLEFHTTDRIMATGSADRTAKVWTLDDDFGLLHSTPRDTTKVRAITFGNTNPENPNDTLICATEGGLRSWDLAEEKVICSCTSQIDYPWKNIQSMSLLGEENNKEGVLAFSSRGSTVAIWSGEFLDTGNESDDGSVASTEDCRFVVPKRQSFREMEGKMGDKKNYSHAADINPKEFQRRLTTHESTPDMQRNARRKSLKARSVSSLVPSVTQRKSKEPLNISYSNFLPRKLVLENAPNYTNDKSTNSSMVENLLDGHENFMLVLSERLDELTELEDLWRNGNPKKVVDRLVTVDDLSIAADFLRHVNLKNGTADLDLFGKLLPLITRMVSSNFEDNIKIALKVGTFLFKSFASIIKSTIAMERRSNDGEVDIAREERLKKCKLCQQGLCCLLSATASILGMTGDETKGEIQKCSRSTLRDARHLHDSLSGYLNK